MRGFGGALFSVGLLMCAARGADGNPTEVTLEVPERVAARAAARAAGEASAPAPILVLENVEVPAGEGFSIVVHGPAEEGSKEPGPELGRTSLVGSRETDRSAPSQRMTLVVPLGDEALQLLAGKREVTFVLRVEGGRVRTMPAFERAHFDQGEDAQ